MDQPAERLNRAIDRWRDWTLDEPLAHRPKLGALLAEGSGHAIYELISHNQKTLPIVARIRRQETRSGGDPLGQELAAWQFASREGLAPKCFYIDDAGVTICRRVSAPAQLVSAEALGTLCGRIHALSITLPRLDLRREIDNHLAALPLAQKNDWQRAMGVHHVSEALMLLERDTPYFCHNDLTEGNLVLHGDRLVAIDWEYAAMGSRYFDLAIAAGSRLAQEQTDVYRAALKDHVDDTLVRAGQRAASLMTALWQTRFTPTEAPCPKVWETQAEKL